MENKDSLRKRIINSVISCFFIIVIVVISILLYCRRDILVYDDNYGYLGVLILCFICNATVLAPAPSLIVVVTAAQSLHPIPVILLGALGTSLGELVGYASGRMGRVLIQKDGRLTAWILRHGAVAVFVLALIPLPLFDIAGIASGYSKMRWYVFFSACFLGKLIKIALYVFGSFLVKSYFPGLLKLIN